MCKPTRSTLTISIRDDQGHEYLVSEPLSFHWAKRLQPKAEEILKKFVVETADELMQECEADPIEDDLLTLFQ